jgi:hypothetical protein
MKRNVLIVFSLLSVISIGCTANSTPVSPEYAVVHQGGRGQGFRTHLHCYVPPHLREFRGEVRETGGVPAARAISGNK